MPADQATVPLALAAANPGDVIQIASGNFPQAFTVNVNDITIQGAGMGSTTLSSSAPSTVVTISATGVVVSDLTVTGGYSNVAMYAVFGSTATLMSVELREGDDSALWAGGSSLDLIDSRVVDNFTVGDGGGVWHFGGTLFVDSTVFCGNNAYVPFYSYGRGGGLYSFGSALTVQRSLFVANSADDYGGGPRDYGLSRRQLGQQHIR